MASDEFKRALYARFLNFTPKKGDLRRIEIIEGAIDCIASIGIEDTSFESIGKKIKMIRAHVAYYYPDRDDIIEAAIKFVVSTVQNYTVEAVKAARTPRERLDGFVHGTFDWIKNHPEHASVILLLYYYSSYHKKFRKLHHEIRTLGVERIAAIVAEILPKKKASVPQAAKLVQSILTGHLVDFTTTESKLDIEEVRKKTLSEISSLMTLYETQVKNYTPK